MTIRDVTMLAPPRADYAGLLPKVGNTGMSGNFVIAFARARLGQIDAYLTRQLGEMEHHNKVSEGINRVLAKVVEFAQGGDGADGRRIKAALVAEIDAAIASLPPGSKAIAQLEYIREHGQFNVGGDDLVSEHEMGALKKELETMAKAYDRVASESQLMVQQRMGERNEVLQLASSLVQSMNDTLKAILGRS